jgi:hypothetical protein
MSVSGGSSISNTSNNWKKSKSRGIAQVNTELADNGYPKVHAKNVKFEHDCPHGASNFMVIIIFIALTS